MSEKNIPVLDLDNKFLSYTSPAKARILLKNNSAIVFNKDPFIIRLKGEPGDLKMKSNNEGFSGNTITSFIKYFAEEKEVYVQNMGSTQISMSFNISDQIYHLIIPKTRKPYIVTQYIPFEAIKNSIDFRRIITRRNPPILRLLKEEEYFEYYENAAKRNKTSIEEEFSIAQNVMENLISKPKEVTDRVQREMESKLEDRIEKLESPVEPLPVIVGLCARADKEEGSSRISANTFLEELESLEGKLKEEDWEFVSTKGVYKSVKKFATSRLEALTITEEDDLDE